MFPFWDLDDNWKQTKKDSLGRPPRPGANKVKPEHQDCSLQRWKNSAPLDPKAVTILSSNFYTAS